MVQDLRGAAPPNQAAWWRGGTAVPSLLPKGLTCKCLCRSLSSLEIVVWSRGLGNQLLPRNLFALTRIWNLGLND